MIIYINSILTWMIKFHNGNNPQGKENYTFFNYQISFFCIQKEKCNKETSFLKKSSSIFLNAFQLESNNEYKKKSIDNNNYDYG